MSDEIRTLLDAAKNKDYQALARLLTVIEQEGPAILRYEELLKPARPSFRLGITGPPGAGKSTLIGQLISKFRAQNMTIAVAAVDPSSPFSKGAILGDRIRYVEHSNDPDIFIRSLGSRGSLGGLSAAAYLFLRAFEVVGFDVVLVETVGVGQTELEIVNVADWVSVVLVPESGDSVQAMKAGLMEIADGFVVNKCDRPGADAMVNELKASFDGVSVIKTVATEGAGVSELIEEVMKHKNSSDWQDSRGSEQRLRLEATALKRMEAERQIQSQIKSISSVDDFRNIFL